MLHEGGPFEEENFRFRKNSPPYALGHGLLLLRSVGMRGSI